MVPQRHRLRVLNRAYLGEDGRVESHDAGGTERVISAVTRLRDSACGEGRERQASHATADGKPRQRSFGIFSPMHSASEAPERALELGRRRPAARFAQPCQVVRSPSVADKGNHRAKFKEFLQNDAAEPRTEDRLCTRSYIFLDMELL